MTPDRPFSQRFGFTRIITTLIAISLLGAGTVLAQSVKNVYRWTDEFGEVNYSKALPPEASTRPYDVLSPAGILLKKINDPDDFTEYADPDEEEEEDNEPEPFYTEEQKKFISDRLLMLRYANEQEIIDAMQLEVDQLKYDARMLDAARASVMTSLRGQVQNAANFQRVEKEIPETDIAKIGQLRQRLVNNRGAMDRLNIREQQIRAQFQSSLERYRALMLKYGTEP